MLRVNPTSHRLCCSRFASRTPPVLTEHFILSAAEALYQPEEQSPTESSSHGRRDGSVLEGAQGSGVKIGEEGGSWRRESENLKNKSFNILGILAFCLRTIFSIITHLGILVLLHS